MLAAVRQAIGPRRKIRIDANQAWSVPEAARLLNDWHARFGIDFVEAPVPIDPVELMLDLKRRVAVPLCVNEGLWRAADAYRIIDSRCGDYLVLQLLLGGLTAPPAVALPRRRRPRAGRCASTPMASSASPRPPAST